MQGKWMFRVALIEDDEAIRMLVRDVLTDAGFEVEAVAETPHLSTDWRGDVILTDAMSRSYIAAKTASTVLELRRRFGAPVVVMSAHAEIVRDRAVIGADDVVVKPFEIDEVVRVLRRVCSSG